jgi:hypothetical protein
MDGIEVCNLLNFLAETLTASGTCLAEWSGNGYEVTSS